MSTTCTRSTEEYVTLARRYSVNIIVDEAPDAPYVAEAAELPYTCGVGSSPEEAVRVLTEAIAGTLETLEDEGRPIPEPLSTFTGMLHLRVPKSLHQAVARRAAVEGVSLNATAIMLLTRALAGEGETVAGARARRS